MGSKNFCSSLSYLSLTFTFLALLLTSSTVNSHKVCRALVLEGGGHKGAYEAGVLYGFVKNAPNPEDFQYDVITGISIGAVNGMGLAQFPRGKELEAVEFLISTWKSTSRADVYKSWPAGLVEGLFFKSSLFDNDPEIDYLRKLIVNPPNQRQLTVVATDFATGEKVVFSEQDWREDVDLAINAALYSSSVPVIFKTRNYGDQVLIDGGWTGEALDIEDAVFRCREMVDSDEEITIDVIFATNTTESSIEGSKFNAFQMFMRHFAIKQFSGASRAYSYAKDSFPDVNFRYVMVASQRLPNQDVPLDFKKESIDFMIDLGVKDALKALNEGPGVSAQRVYDEAAQFDDDLFFNSGQY